MQKMAVAIIDQTSGEIAELNKDEQRGNSLHDECQSLVYSLSLWSSILVVVVIQVLISCAARLYSRLR